MFERISKNNYSLVLYFAIRIVTKLDPNNHSNYKVENITNKAL
jgi:hypothetical protein